jgi:hypothetical protein
MKLRTYHWRGFQDGRLAFVTEIQAATYNRVKRFRKWQAGTRKGLILGRVRRGAWVKGRS